MSKKNRRDRQSALSAGHSGPAVNPESISHRGWKVVGAGIFILVIGFAVLKAADPMGRNWASVVSPFLILSGYALVGLGILA